MNLDEVLQQSAQWKWTFRSTGSDDFDAAASFDVKGKQYTVTFSEDHINELLGLPDSSYFDDEDEDNETHNLDNEIVVEISFVLESQAGTPDITGTGDEFLVFGTVLTIIRQYLSAKPPPYIAFNAKEKSRIKLYDRLSRLLTKAGWKPQHEETGRGMLYVFSRPK